ncbi:Hypp4268 [Branchiostoma lanceolatum]|uniref:Hypp4268 protein n=1 Tax=Branchiostoma lanceolatum TaxID=7740 RepID=A0A8K0EXQ8_BRALA|nr:Hypp4268 [Branchiostoma lanceolatum]
MASPVKSSRFRTLKVTKKTSIKDFVSAHKLEFEKGKGFYQLTKPEIIQDYKEIVARRKSDGSFISGSTVRSTLGIPDDAGKKFKFDLSKIPDFDVFIQSTSYNRALMPDTEFLYEVSGGGDEPAPPAPAAGGKKRKTEAGPAATTTTKKRGVKAEPKAEPADEASAPPPAPPGGGGPMEIVFCFDTTGSMYPCLAEVRKKIQDVVKRLHKDIAGIRMALMAHGDYQDAASTYDVTWLDFTTDQKRLCNWAKSVKNTCGYDADECYELALRKVRTQLSWTPGTQRSLVMIGDCEPHAPNYPLNKEKIDWKKEADLLAGMGVHIYAVQSLDRRESTKFYKELARRTHGCHLNLNQFSSIVDFMMAICYRERGADQLEAYEKEVRSRRGGGGMNRELHQLFDVLTGRKTTFTATGAAAGDLEPVSPSRFQVLTVDERCDIKTFVMNNSLIFKTGRGFYEFTKPEKISDKKEVVLVDKTTGDMFTGPEACDMIGAGGSGRIKPASLDSWRVFVQSTSYNRVLMPDTGFLYEVDPEH